MAEGGRAATARTRMAGYGLGDPARAARLLAAEPLSMWDAERGAPADDGAGRVLLGLADAADPDLAVTGLVRLAEALDDLAPLRKALCGDDVARRRLLSLLGGSAALTDHLVRHPEDWHLVEDAHDGRPSRSRLEAALLEAVGADPDFPPDGTGGSRARGGGTEELDALRAAYRRQMLGLAARDLAGEKDVEDVAAELSDLAGAALSAALAIAATGLPDDATPCRLAVIGMGKCGARELNYVSDVDVIFVAEPALGPDGEPDPDADESAALVTAAKLATELMRVCSASTPEGELWPVDPALRPEGKSGPLVRTLASHEAYYGRWARTWEFQALLKARPVAGDLALGSAWMAATAPLVWAAAGRQDFVEDVQAMRKRVESTLRREATRELKLGPGGLRDVEFAVQLLQLVHGRTDEALRDGATLPALRALAESGYVGREDARRLDSAYRWLRLVEHRLQLHHLRRTHLLPAPDDDAGRRFIARASGCRGNRYGDALHEFDYIRAGYSKEVRRLHEKLFYRPLLAAVARLPEDGAALSPDAARERLSALGYDDPRGALRHLEALTSGVSRRASIQKTLLPAMLSWFADEADPDAGLLAFRRLSDALGATPWYLRMLRDEGAAAENLAHLLAGSRYVADLLERAPEGVMLLGYDDELVPRDREALTKQFLAVVRRRDEPSAGVAAALGLRRQELLRVAVADLLGRSDVEQVGAGLSDVVAATLEAAVEAARLGLEAERGPLPVRLAIIAMGRLGGREQGYGSDADVLFVHDRDLDGPEADEEECARVARAWVESVRKLAGRPGPDPPLEVDADLRPEGKAGALTRSLSGYAGYYERWSSPWEAQALLRAAPIAGDADLGRSFVELVDPLRYPRGGPGEEALREVRRLKARMENERLPRGADPALHTKLGRGALSDVEWTVQLLQMQSAAEVPGLRTPTTLPALRAAAEAGLLEADDAEVLEEAWRLATRARNGLRLVRGRPGDSLPSVGGRELLGIARALGGTEEGAGIALLEDYRRATRRARAVVERVFYG
jgi:[glutamine synthetase] adenylyltransferase / [glutamine synthetase]-adenylyl-L-tyrosine phosphorylase